MFLRNYWNSWFGKKDYAFSVEKDNTGEVIVEFGDEIAEAEGDRVGDKEEIKEIEAANKTWEDLPLEIILYIATYLEIKDLCRFLLINKQTHNAGLQVFADNIKINNEIKLKGMTSAEVRSRLSEFLIKREKAKAKLLELENHHINKFIAKHAYTPVSCALTLTCFGLGGFFIFIGATLHATKNDFISDLSNGFLIGGETAAAIGLVCNVACCVTFFGKKRQKKLDKTANDLRQKLDSELAIQYKPN